MKFFILIVLFSVNCFAEKEIISQGLIWARYNLVYNISPKFEIQQEIEERSYWFPQRQHQFLTRSHLNFKINQNLTSQIGFTNFLQTLPHDPYNENSYDRLELRPQFGLRYKQAVDDNISLTHRYWNEFRFIENESSFYFRNFRFRYQLTLKYKLNKKIALKAFDEIFLNFGRKIINNTFDQNRYGLGIDYKFNRYFRFDLMYFNWFQQRSSGNVYFNRDIFRFTVNNSF